MIGHPLIRGFTYLMRLTTQGPVRFNQSSGALAYGLEEYEFEGNSFPNQELSAPLPGSYDEVVRMFGVNPRPGDLFVSFDLQSPEWWAVGLSIPRLDWLRMIPSAYFTRLPDTNDLGVALIPMCVAPEGLQLIVRQRFQFEDDDST